MKLTQKTMFQSDSGRLFEREDDAIRDELEYWLSAKVTDSVVLDDIFRNRELILKVLTDINLGMVLS